MSYITQAPGSKTLTNLKKLMFRLLLITNMAVGCILLTPELDTPDRRLQVYYHNPKAEFCYKWTPKTKERALLYDTKKALDKLYKRN